MGIILSPLVYDNNLLAIPSGYPLAGCSSAEPVSVSPNKYSIAFYLLHHTSGV